MVISKSAVAEKLAELKAYSVELKPAAAGLFAPVEAALNTYYTLGGVSELLREVILFMHMDIARRTTVYENNFPYGLRTDCPAGYNDISMCFYQFTEILTISNDTFYSGFVMVDESEDPEVPLLVLHNTYLDSWEDEILANAQSVKDRLSALSEWCQDAANADLVFLYEDQGATVSEKGLRDIGAEIYLERNALAVIETCSLSTYIPSWLDGFFLDSRGDLELARITEPFTFEYDENKDARLCVPATASTYFEVDSAGDVMARSDV